MAKQKKDPPAEPDFEKFVPEDQKGNEKPDPITRLTPVINTARASDFFYKFIRKQKSLTLLSSFQPSLHNQ